MPRAIPAVIFVTLVMLALALALWHLSFVLLLAFFGLLIAVLLRHMALMISGHTSLSASAALGIVVLALLTLIGLGIYYLGAQIAGQISLLADSLPLAVENVSVALEGQALIQRLLEMMPVQDAAPEWNIFGALRGTVSIAIGILANVVVVATIAIFLAGDPQLYRRGVLHLIPMDKRPRAVEIMDALGNGLWRWLLGQGLSMLFVALLTAGGLWMLGIPLWLTLGVIAGIADFIPYVGPWLGAAPAVLLAFSEGPQTAVYTAILFVIIQQLEGNVLQPIIQKRANSMPPVLTVLSVIAFGVLFGFAGILVATPLLLVLMILVRMIYVEDVLEDPTVAMHEELEQKRNEKAKA